MAYTRRRRETAEQRLEKERSRLGYLRGRLEVVEVVEDDPEGYELTVASGAVIDTDKAEMLAAIRDRIASTENTIANIENEIRRAAGQQVERRPRGVISIASNAEMAMHASAEARKKLIAGA